MSKPDHHERRDLCSTRAPYREGRKPTAVKVYTVNQESKYLLIQGVPAVGAREELLKLFGSHGDIGEVRPLDDYPSEKFTEVYLICYKRLQSARMAKRRLDDWSFYGGVLHVCYAPEYETLQDTREKLQDRRRVMAAKVKQYNRDGTYTANSTSNKDSIPETTVPSTETQVMTYQDQGQVNSAAHTKLTEDGIHGQTTCYDMTSHTIVPSASSLAHSESSDNSPNTSSHFAQSGDYCKTITQPHMDRSSGQFPGGGLVNWSSDGSICNNQNGQERRHVGHVQNSRPNLSYLQLPPPPIQSKCNNPQSHGKSDQTYGFARVPSAHAGFPADFDARLDPRSNSSSLPHEDDNDLGNEKGDNGIVEEFVHNSNRNEVQEMLVSKTMQEKINDNLKSDKVVIKDYNAKKGSVPKFVPRQMQSKVKSLGKSKPQTTVSEKDNLTKELRRNAFTLRDRQGPEDIDQDKKQGPELQIASVEKSVKEIRKHVSQFSDRSRDAVPTKRQKMKES